MTWRRFTTLLFGLSAKSRFALQLAYQREHVTLTDATAVDRYVASIGG